MIFSEIIGQDRQIRMIQSALRSGNISHAYLFSGSEGTGKCLTALSFAKALNCLSLGDDSCNQCNSCKKFNNGNFPDIIQVEPIDGSIKIETIRELQKKVSLRPYEGRFKVVLIKGVEDMTIAAANSFLKTLEEPTESTVFILISNNYHLLLPTIISRCQRIHFNLIPVEIIKKVLIQNSSMRPEEAHLIASYSQGCLGKAMEMDINDVIKKRDSILDFMKNISFEQMDLVFKKSKVWAGDNEAVEDILTTILNIIRDLTILKISINNKLITNWDVKDILMSLVKNIHISNLISLFDTVEQTIRLLKRNANVQLLLDQLLIKMCVFFDRGVYGKCE